MTAVHQRDPVVAPDAPRRARRIGPDALRRLTERRWAAVAASGALIAAAFASRPFARGAFAPLLLAATAVAGWRIARQAVSDLRLRRVGIELLVTVAVVGAVVIGELWEAAAVTFLFRLGHTLEVAAVGRTRRALARLFELVPETATVRRRGVEVEVDPSEVAVGETVVVRPGGKVPVDGEVVGGRAAVDEATITGESMPVEKSAGSTVYAGTTTAGGMIEVRATGVGPGTALGRIIRRVEEAQESKARSQRFMERFAAWYTPAVILLAAGAYALTRDVELSLTLLVIGCPGALVISIPVAVVAGIGQSARYGILVKGGEHLEQVGRVTAVAFDKTGTLTAGRPRLTDVVASAEGTTARQVLTWAAVAEAGSEHPFARPILEGAAAEGIEVASGGEVDPDAFVAHVAAGVETVHEGRRVAVGTPTLAVELGVEVPASATATLEDIRSRGRTAVLVMRDDEVVGVVGVADEVRPDAAEAVARLRAEGVERVVMLTGDAPAVARAVAGAVGIDDVRAGLTPEDKLQAIRDLRAAGHVVAMVGDGVNDAPALATADVGVAMGVAGTAVAVETADVALMSERLTRLADAVRLSRRTVRVVRQNVALALVTVGALLAGVLAGEVFMAGGMLVHQASVLLVVANAARLLRGRPDDAPLEHDLRSALDEPPTGPVAATGRYEPAGVSPARG